MRCSRAVGLDVADPAADARRAERDARACGDARQRVEDVRRVGLQLDAAAPPGLRDYRAGMWDRDTWELLSYVVTVIGLPLAIAVFLWEQRRERQQEDEEIYQRLADEYTGFMKLVLGNADLQLLRREGPAGQLTAEQQERRFALFSILVALFERAFLLVYEPKMDRKTSRLWKSWEDFMGEWCRRLEFRQVLPELLQGEDPEFAACIQRIAGAEAARAT